MTLDDFAEAFMQWRTAVFVAGIERTREEVGAGV